MEFALSEFVSSMTWHWRSGYVEWLSLVCKHVERYPSWVPEARAAVFCMGPILSLLRHLQIRRLLLLWMLLLKLLVHHHDGWEQPAVITRRHLVGPQLAQRLENSNACRNLCR